MTDARSIDALFQLLLSDPTQPVRGTSVGPARTIERAAEPELSRALDALAPHKVLPLLCHRLRQAELLAGLPESARARLLAVEAEVRGLNTLLFLAAAALLRAAARRGEELLVLKGLLLADSYYPEPVTRPMGDLDLVAAPGRREVLHAVLEEVGFARVEDHVHQDHAVAFLNPQGVACDAHAYIEAFPGADWAQVTRSVAMRRLAGVTVRVLEPHVMIAHLVLHMHGHSRDLGLVLLWLLDLVFVLRRHGAELDPGRLRGWLADDQAWTLWLRVLGLFERHGEVLPPALSRLRSGVPPLSLGSVLRARRTRPWGLPYPLGWARLLAHHLALRDYSHRQLPELRDLWLLPVDLLTSRATQLSWSMRVRSQSW